MLSWQIQLRANIAVAASHPTITDDAVAILGLRIGRVNAVRAPVAIVAVESYYKHELMDWSAYIGGTTDTWKEESAIDAVAEHGDKLSEKDARYFFPHLPPEKWRA